MTTEFTLALPQRRSELELHIPMLLLLKVVVLLSFADDDDDDDGV